MTDKVYYSENIDFNDQKRLLSLAKSSSLPAGYFAITLSDKEDQLLVSYCHADVNRKNFKDTNHTIVGIAKGSRQSNKLIRDIIEDVYTSTNGLDVKKYFS